MASGYFAFDIERTGQKLTDVTFAVGFAMAGATEPRNMTSSSISLKLRTDDEIKRGVTWEEIWRQRGWEMRCYTEFWSKNLCTLEMLQDPSRVNLTDNPEDIPKFINNRLLHAEAEYPNLNIITDTVAFDTVFVSLLLLSSGYRELSASRDGKYRWGYEIDSYALGAMRCTP